MDESINVVFYGVASAVQVAQDGQVVFSCLAATAATATAAGAEAAKHSWQPQLWGTAVAPAALPGSSQPENKSRQVLPVVQDCNEDDVCQLVPGNSTNKSSAMLAELMPTQRTQLAQLTQPSQLTPRSQLTQPSQLPPASQLHLPETSILEDWFFEILTEKQTIVKLGDGNLPEHDCVAQVLEGAGDSPKNPAKAFLTPVGGPTAICWRKSCAGSMQRLATEWTVWTVEQAASYAVSRQL